MSLGRRIDPVSNRIRSLIRAIQDNDEAKIEEAILRLSRSRRVFAPLALAVSAFVLLFDGLRLLVSNWRLTLVTILPAMWIWLAMFDLKVHVLHGKTFHVIRGPILIPICLAIVAITMAGFFLNAVFAFAIARPGRPEVRPAVEQARRHLTPIFVSGAIVGALLAFSTMIVSAGDALGSGSGSASWSGSMMVCYVAVPARLIGGKPSLSRRDKLTTSAVGGAIGATVCTPPYLLGRLGLLMLGSKVLFIPGILVIAIGVTLQAGATGAVRAIKLSASLTAGRHFEKGRLNVWHSERRCREAEPATPQNSDVTRRTWLAAERTWLAWWRTGIGASAVAIGVGRIVPELTHGARWPFRVLGIAYGLIAIAILVIGAVRQQRTNVAPGPGWGGVSMGAVVLVAVRL